MKIEPEKEGIKPEQLLSPRPEISAKAADEIDQAREKENLRKIEAALFIAAKWINIQELIMLTDINPILLKQLVEKLKEKYSQEGTSIEILEKQNMWKMDVKPDYTYMVNKLATGNSEFTKAEQETLAIIAYKQPIKQSIIIKIRGNKAYDHIKKFVNLTLVKAKKLGHTKELTLSEEFYDYFHVRNSKEFSEHDRNSKEFRHITKQKLTDTTQEK